MLTQEQIQERKNYIGASDAPIIMGISPWKTPYELWQQKLSLVEDNTDNFAIRRGNDLEPIARKAYINYTGIICEPKFMVHNEIAYMSANLDGLSLDGNIAVEIKCPGKKDHETAKNGEVPEKYYPQLQHQLAVLNHDVIHYFSYYNEDDFILIEVKRNDEYINNLYNKEREFWHCVENFIPPEGAKIAKKDKKEFVERDDVEWNKLAELWISANEELQIASKQLKEAQDKEKLLRLALIEMADNQSCIGGNIQFEQSSRKGLVDYNAIPELKNVDLEKYRKPPTTTYKISVVK